MTARRAFVVAYATMSCFAYAMIDASPCICGRLRRASRTLSRLDRPGLLELAETTAHEKSALWRTLQPLERKGWVAAETEPGARGQKLSVTPAGLEKLAAALPLWRTAQTRVSDILGPREAALIAATA